MTPEPLLSVRDLGVHFFTPRGTVHAVNGVSFDLQPGERMAIVGESGSGKSVTAMSLMRLIGHPGRMVSGSVRFKGRDLAAMSPKELNAVRGKEISMVFQDPMTSLNPVLRVDDLMLEPINRHLGLKGQEARDYAAGLLAQVGIPDPSARMRSYPHELSGGMRQRVLIAMALSCKPDLLIADEPTTALDVTIQAQIVALLRNLSENMGVAVLFVTHDLGLVARFADRIAVMYAGRIQEYGPVRSIFRKPLHPYTKGLLRSTPAIAGDRVRRLAQIDGAPPDMKVLPVSCAFAPRCPSAMDICTTLAPAMETVEPEHGVACWRHAGVKSAEREGEAVGNHI
jgi:peptide/nickel transport system ATP-binding protein